MMRARNGWKRWTSSCRMKPAFHPCRIELPSLLNGTGGSSLLKLVYTKGDVHGRSIGFC